MPRLETVLGVFSAFFLVAIIAAVPAIIDVPLPARPAVATSTIADFTDIALPPLALPALTDASTTVATTSPASPAPLTVPKTAAAPKPKAPTQAPAPMAAESAAASPAPVSEPVGSDAVLNAASTRIRAALVNIICYVPAGTRLHSISGSGVIIDSKGVILTNAHVAQYFLLQNQGVDCTVRAGSPAADRYTAALLYISPVWVKANAAVLTEDAPIGTGEEDFALLGITGSVTSAPLPSSFSYLAPAATVPGAGAPIVIASYGAQFLQSAQIQSALFPTIVFGSVKDLYTFGTNTADVLALGGSAAAQEGSSGGGVATAEGELAGTITTSTVTGTTDTRQLNAITLPYIRRAYEADSGESFDTLLMRPLADSMQRFAPQIPALEALLLANL